MKILFRVLMGIAALVGYTHTILGTGSSTGGNQSDNDAMELIEYAGIALGAGASSDLQFTASLTGSVATMSSSLLPANTATQNNAITAANAIFEISIVSNKSAGFTVELKSTNDGNFNRGDAGACISETGTGDGTAGDNSDALCITYEIECNDITHDETNDASLVTTFNSDVGTAGEWMKLETTDGTAYATAGCCISRLC